MRANGLEDIARKREGGLEIAPPPVGRGFNITRNQNAAFAFVYF